jgi:hypothetical protein
MSPRTPRSLPHPSLLPPAIHPVLEALDLEIETLSSQLYSASPLSREVPSFLTERSDSDERHLDDDRMSDVLRSRSSQRPPRWRALFPLSIAAAIVGVSFSAWGFGFLFEESRPKNSAIFIDSPTTGPFQFAKPGNTVGLCYLSGIRNAPMPGVYLRGPSNALVVIKATFDAEQSPVQSLTGKVANINGRRGLVIPQTSSLSTLVQWRIGRTYVTVIGVRTNEEELMAISRSVKLRFTQNGAEVQSFSAPGFVQDLDANSSPSSASVSYGSCGVATESAHPNFMVLTRTIWPIEEQPGPDFAEVRVPYPLVWNNRPIAGSLVTRTYGQEKVELIAWTDSGTDFELRYEDLSSDQVDRIIRGLSPISPVAFDNYLRETKRGTRRTNGPLTPPTASPA